MLVSNDKKWSAQAPRGYWHMAKSRRLSKVTKWSWGPFKTEGDLAWKPKANQQNCYGLLRGFEVITGARINIYIYNGTGDAP